MDRTTLDSLLLVAFVLLGLSLGTLLGGLAKSRTAEAAQAHAYARSNRLPSRFRREPRWYARQGRRASGFLFLAALGTWVATWLALGSVPLPTPAEIPYFGFGIILSAVVGLFPIIAGGLLVTTIIVLKIAFGLAFEGWSTVFDPTSELPIVIAVEKGQPSVVVETTSAAALYRIVLPALQYRLEPAPPPNPSTNQPALFRFGHWLVTMLPGITSFRLPLSLPVDPNGKVAQVQLLTNREITWKYKD